jgi:hypothetical protein
MKKEISERIIEDILCADKRILADVLSVNVSRLNILARQKALNSGKLDVLCLYDNELLLIELKVTNFYNGIILQLHNYARDLRQLQKENKLINTKIREIALVTGFSSRDKKTCEESGVELLKYEPDSVLKKYYEDFKEISYFLKIQSGDFGVWRLSLLNTTLSLLGLGKTVKEIAIIEGKSEKTINNRLNIAIQLGLVSKFKYSFFLTEFGEIFIKNKDRNTDDILSFEQIEQLDKYLIENPFISSITYSIYSVVESVFVLAKNEYPVPFEKLRTYFVESVGKSETWRTERARTTATNIFCNYSCELELLAEIDNCYFITPKGIKSILLLQLNRSIKLIEAGK